MANSVRAHAPAHPGARTLPPDVVDVLDTGVGPPHRGRRYRADLDGLRGVAVLLVVLFHLEVVPFTGGYVGVDVFFVVSGFLITDLIRSDLDRDAFSLLRFYERRVRRIFPALFVAVALVLIAGWFVLMPGELRDVGSAAVGATTFSANVLAWLQTDYFAGPVHLRPLLHTWSLAVEEQFYLAFPLVMIVAHRWSRRSLPAVVTALAVASFAASCAWVAIDGSANYYLPHTRAWELLAGALVALGVVRPPRRVRRAAALSLVALAAMLAPAVVLDADSTFPAYNALPAVAGTVVLVAVGQRHRTGVQRLLGSAPLVRVGVISYSLYLVHWPLIVFARYVLLRPPTPAENVAIAVASVGLAVLSYRWVEQPLRRSTGGSARRVVGVGTAAGAVLAAAGLVAFLAAGFPGRFPNAEALATADEPPPSPCFMKAGWQDWTSETCRLTTGGGERVLLWGDSHAYHYVPAIRARAGRYDEQILLYASAGCPPVTGVDIAGRPHCRGNNAHALDLVRELDVDRVVLAAEWQEAFERNGLTLDDLAASIAPLRRSGVTVDVIGDNPNFPFDNPGYLALRLSERDRPDADFATTVRNDRRFNARMARLDGIAAFHDPMAVLCEGDECLVFTDGELLVRDNAHLSPAGASLLLDAMAPFDRSTGE